MGKKNEIMACPGCPDGWCEGCVPDEALVLGYQEEGVWVHLERDEWVNAASVRWESLTSDSGVAVIGGVEYDIVRSYDGDGYLQMTDSEIDRYHQLNG